MYSNYTNDQLAKEIGNLILCYDDFEDNERQLLYETQKRLTKEN